RKDEERSDRRNDQDADVPQRLRQCIDTFAVLDLLRGAIQMPAQYVNQLGHDAVEEPSETDDESDAQQWLDQPGPVSQARQRIGNRGNIHRASPAMPEGSIRVVLPRVPKGLVIVRPGPVPRLRRASDRAIA